MAHVVHLVYQCMLEFFSSIEIPYGDKDQKGDYTLQAGDLIDFNIATDRRDKLHRATNIQLVEDTFKISGERRDTVSHCRVGSVEHHPLSPI